MGHQFIVTTATSVGTGGDSDECRVWQDVVDAPREDVPRVVIMGGVHEHCVGGGRLEDPCAVGSKEAGHWDTAILEDKTT